MSWSAGYEFLGLEPGTVGGVKGYLDPRYPDIKKLLPKLNSLGATQERSLLKELREFKYPDTKPWMERTVKKTRPDLTPVKNVGGKEGMRSSLQQHAKDLNWQKDWSLLNPDQIKELGGTGDRVTNLEAERLMSADESAIQKSLGEADAVLQAEENEAAQSLTLGSIPEKSTSRLEVPEGAFDPERLEKIFGDSRLNIPSEGGEDLVNVINESLTKRLQNKARGNTLTSTGSVGGKGSIANNAQRLLERQGAGVNQASKAASKAVEEVVPQIPSLEGLEVPEGAFDPDQLEKFFGTGAEKAADVAEKGMNLSFGPLGMGSFNTATGALGLANPWMIGLNFLKKIAETNQAKANLPKNVPSTFKPGLTKKKFPYYVGR